MSSQYITQKIKDSVSLHETKPNNPQGHQFPQILRTSTATEISSSSKIQQSTPNITTNISIHPCTDYIKIITTNKSGASTHTERSFMISVQRRQANAMLKATHFPDDFFANLHLVMKVSHTQIQSKVHSRTRFLRHTSRQHLTNAATSWKQQPTHVQYIPCKNFKMKVQ